MWVSLAKHFYPTLPSPCLLFKQGVKALTEELLTRINLFYRIKSIKNGYQLTTPLTSHSSNFNK